ncbi:hypothetical protein E2N92_08260 [Methanofollis formosanus]|uniref:Uncharacterized protein n=1 Tax=Methanofollis formosanus TaxID=299308 RepID=A0A8G1EGQ3_9EURY|nr:hypothetical protein [Methanofollis formosanus]QYZ79424.1 hypothetical protein E2N92_08260 [Methanofollis formosanus]
MVTREEIYNESKREIADSLPKIIVEIVIAFLIWLFAVYIFIPLAGTLSDPTFLGLIGLQSLISGIVIVALIIIFIAILKEVIDVTNAIAGYATLAFSKGEVSEEKLGRYQTGFRLIGYVLLAVIAYLFFLPLIAGILGVLAGVILVLLVIWAIIVLFQAGRIFSTEIEEKAADFSKRVEKLKEEGKPEEKEE